MKKFRLPCLLAGAVVGLASCGKSQDARKVDAVRCHGFMTAMLATMQDLEHPSGFVDVYGAVAKERLKGRDAEGEVTVTLGEQLASQMESTKSAAAQQDGSQSWLKFQKANDGEGAVAYVENCIANHDKLLAAAR